jgi:serine phosphatase RsbU (regulator of sigma subunit)
MLRDDGGELVFRAARGVDQQTIESPQFEISRSVVEQVARDGQPTYTSDAQSDKSLGGRESVVVLGLRSILCVPVQLEGKIIGVIYVDNRLQKGLFKPDDLDLLTAIGSSAAIAIENARLYQVAIDKGRLERELQVAREVQISLLPRETPKSAGWDFAAYWHPARQVSGDFYDFVPFDGHKLGLVIADVSDKGMPAALFMALSRSIVRASVTSLLTPGEAITRANRLICADAANGMFVTLCYATVDLNSGEITYVNAGHNPPLWYHAAGKQFEELTLTGMALGIFDGVEYKQRTVELKRGDFIFCYTDGVSEASNALREEFGLERMQQLLLKHCKRSASEMMTELKQAVHAFTGDAPPFDDLTMLIIKRS